MIPNPREPALILHSQPSMPAQRIIAMSCGYEDLNDHQTLRDDPCFQVLSERQADSEKPPASPPTLWRLEDRADIRKSWPNVKIIIHADSGFPMQNLFRQIVARLTADPAPVFSSG